MVIADPLTILYRQDSRLSRVIAALLGPSLGILMARAIHLSAADEMGPFTCTTCG